MALLEAIPKQFTIATNGMKDADGKNLIDHFAVSPDLNAKVTEIVPRFSPDGTRLSDHVGLMATLQTNQANKPIE